MYINNGKPVPSRCFTEKYGTHQCMLAVRESLMQRFGTAVDDSVIENVLRFGTADIGEKYLSVIQKGAILEKTIPKTNGMSLEELEGYLYELARKMM